MTIENNSSRIAVAIALSAMFLFPIVATVKPALAQSDMSVETAYSSSYEIAAADVTRPVTVNAETHLYHPGERVSVEGSVFGEVVDALEALNVVKVEIKDWTGDVVAMSDAQLDRQTGVFETTLKLPDNSSTGTFTVESRIELEADALGIVETITSATLQSSQRIAVANPNGYEVIVENQTYLVQVASNSALDGFEFKQQEKTVSIFAEGESGTTGVMEVSVPKVLLSGEMAVFIDGSLMSEEQVILKSDTDTETTFEINYGHSIHQVEVTGTNVVPEFPAVLTMAIAAVVGVVAVATRKITGAGTRWP